MKWKQFTVVGVVACAALQAHACFDPLSVYSAGVVFSRGETIAVENIEQFGDESASYLKTCEKVTGNSGQPYIVGSIEEKPVDMVTIDSAWVKLNTLYLDVQYGGGCRVHTFALYTDGIVTDTPPAMQLYLSHDADGDNCKALVRETLQFDLAGLYDKPDLLLRIYAPGQSDGFEPSPVWNPAMVDGMKCSYKMRSACSDRVMAYIGRYIGYSSTQTSSFDQLLVIFDSTQAVPTAEEKVAALKAEIARLEGMNVLSMTELQVQSLEKQLLAITSGQYWTAEDTVLQFNQWFDGGQTNGVRGVYGAKGGCGAGVDYELPAGTLEPVSIVPRIGASATSAPSAFCLGLRNGLLTAEFPAVHSNARVVLTALDGRVVAEVPVAAGSRRTAVSRTAMNTLTRGCYIVSLHENGRAVQSSLFSFMH